MAEGVKVYVQGACEGWLASLSMSNYTYKTTQENEKAKQFNTPLSARELCDKLTWITYGNAVGVIETIPKIKKRGMRV